MKTKNKAVAAGNALAVAVGAIYVVCAIFVYLFPDTALYFARSWIHGLEISGSVWNPTPESFVVGLVSAMLLSWLAGFFYSTVYNLFVDSK